MNHKILSILMHNKAAVKIAVALLLFVASISLFVSIADEVGEGDSLAYDRATLLFINHYFSPYLDVVMVVGTDLGGVIGVSIISLITAALLTYKKVWRKLVFFVSSVGGAVALNVILKGIFARERPNLFDRLVTETSFSFPSGHAMASSILSVSIVVLLWKTKWRVPTIVLAVIFMLFIGFSRLYLGVHYPTDILAGWSVSIAWAVTVYLILFDSSKLLKLLYR